MNQNKVHPIWVLLFWATWGGLFLAFLVWILIPNGHSCKYYIYWFAVPLGSCIGLLVGGLTVAAGNQ